MAGLGDRASNIAATTGVHTVYLAFVSVRKRVFDSMGCDRADFQIDLLFLDGDHSYAGCMSDLTTYGPLAKVIAVHDTNSNFVGVWESVISYFRSNHVGCFSRAEFFNGSNGLGVLYR